MSAGEQEAQFWPTKRDWKLVALSAIPLLLVLYGTACCGALLEKREKHRESLSSAAAYLASLQQKRGDSSIPLTIDTARAQLQVDGDNVNDYLARYRPANGGPPEIVVCASSCESQSQRVHLRLAFAHHEDREMGSDKWDFWFAPTEGGQWIGNPLRLLYRVNPGQPDHWGLVLGNQTDENVEFTENKIAGLHDLGDTEIADFAHSIVDSQQVEDANFIGAPTSSLTAHSGFLESGSSFSLPFSQPIGRLAEDAGQEAGDFVAGAAAEAGRWTWIFFVLAVLELLYQFFPAMRALWRAWGAVLDFGFCLTIILYRFIRDEIKAKGSELPSRRTSSGV